MYGTEGEKNTRLLFYHWARMGQASDVMDTVSEERGLA